MLQVVRCWPAGGLHDSPSEPVGHPVGQFFGLDQLGACDLVAAEVELVQVGGIDGSAVEDREKLVSFGRVGCPIENEQLGDVDLDPEFLSDLADRRSSGALASLDVAAGDLPPVLVGRLQDGDRPRSSLNSTTAAMRGVAKLSAGSLTVISLRGSGSKDAGTAGQGVKLGCDTRPLAADPFVEQRVREEVSANLVGCLDLGIEDHCQGVRLLVLEVQGTRHFEAMTDLTLSWHSADLDTLAEPCGVLIVAHLGGNTDAMNGHVGRAEGRPKVVPVFAQQSGRTLCVVQVCLSGSPILGAGCCHRTDEVQGADRGDQLRVVVQRRRRAQGVVDDGQGVVVLGIRQKGVGDCSLDAQPSSRVARPDSIFSIQLTVLPTRPARTTWDMPRRRR